MSNATRISPKEAHEKLSEGWTYVDVRTVEEFEAGHPAGAYNVPIMHAAPQGMTANDDFARVMKASFPKDAKIICGCKSAGRSLRAAQVLLAEGFTNVLHQGAGWDGARNAFGQVSEPGWGRLGLPSETGEPTGRSWEDLKKKA